MPKETKLWKIGVQSKNIYFLENRETISLKPEYRELEEPYPFAQLTKEQYDD